MVGTLTDVLGVGLGAVWGTGLDALGAGVLEKWIAPKISGNREHARFVGIIAGGTVSLIGSSPSALARGHKIGSTITTIFWSTVNGSELADENSSQFFMDITGIGAGFTTATLIELFFPYPLIGMIAGSVIGRLVATMYQKQEKIKFDDK